MVDGAFSRFLVHAFARVFLVLCCVYHQIGSHRGAIIYSIAMVRAARGCCEAAAFPRTSIRVSWRILAPGHTVMVPENRVPAWPGSVYSHILEDINCMITALSSVEVHPYPRAERCLSPRSRPH